MTQDNLTTKHQLTICELIRAKSDLEIARLLRQSRRLLNLHRRRRSSISNRERWTDYELRLLGRIRDEELGKLLRRGVSAVGGKRKSLGLPILAPQLVRWSMVNARNRIARQETRWRNGQDVGPDTTRGAIEAVLVGDTTVLGG